jgi:hypothetical protein
VRLAVTAPGDLAVVRDDHVELQGTVRPSTATVTVEGRRAAVAVSRGTFRASVPLEAGTNVIDVIASAGRARPALTAIRVKREISVPVPDVTGLPLADARTRLEGLGLKVEVKRTGGGFFDRLLPGDPSVCDMSPAAGDAVDPGTKVQLVVSRAC